MAWGTEGRDLPANWKDLVRQVKVRDENRCRWILPSGKRCPRPGVDVDHRHGPTRHKLSDLWLLCREHHDRKTQREAWAGRSRPKTKKRREERQPGRL